MFTAKHHKLDSKMFVSYFLVVVFLLASSVSLVNSEQNENDNNINLNKNIKNNFNSSGENSEKVENAQPEDDDTALTTLNLNNYVATTPKITIKPTKVLSRYEQGLEDYDEAIERLDKEKKEEKMNNVINPMQTLFNVISTALSSGKSSKTNIQANDYHANEKSTNDQDDKHNENDFQTTSSSTELAVAEGRYIKGDPLNGYYDWIITEGSYKFWAAFQLATAALIIYSTLAAIYYSKVNPLTSDYDYIDYFGGRSFSGRSIPESTSSSYWPTLNNGQWLGTAAHAFQFVMDAIEKVPQ